MVVSRTFTALYLYANDTERTDARRAGMEGLRHKSRHSTDAPSHNGSKRPRRRCRSRYLYPCPDNFSQILGCLWPTQTFRSRLKPLATILLTKLSGQHVWRFLSEPLASNWVGGPAQTKVNERNRDVSPVGDYVCTSLAEPRGLHQNVTVKDTNPLIAEELSASPGLIFCDPRRFPFWSGRTHRSSA
jgi:hypothetical protein